MSFNLNSLSIRNFYSLNIVVFMTIFNYFEICFFIFIILELYSIKFAYGKTIKLELFNKHLLLLNYLASPNNL